MSATPAALGRLRQRDHVIVMAVHAAIRNQSQQMEPMRARLREAFLQHRITRQFSLRDRLINSSQVLINDSAGAEIQMAHFGIAHLSFRQTDIQPAGAQPAPGIILVELVVKRRAREQSRIAIFFALLPAARIDPPSVTNQEHNRACHTARNLPMFLRMDKRFFR